MGGVLAFKVFIDESGEAGIAKVRDANNPGASPYFVLGAAVFQRKAEAQTQEVIRRFREKIGKQSWKHATELNHYEKVLFSRMLAGCDGRYFAVISNKATLGEYKKTIQNDPQKFYNKCACYLLELVCGYLSRFEVKEEQVSVYFEQRNHDYSQLMRYIGKVRSNPQHHKSLSLKLLNPTAIHAINKGDNDAMEAADLVAHAVYQCANKTPKNFEIPEARYFTELAPRFAGDENNRIEGTGLKCIHSVSQLELDSDIEELLKNAKSMPPRKT